VDAWLERQQLQQQAPTIHVDSGLATEKRKRALSPSEDTGSRKRLRKPLRKNHDEPHCSSRLNPHPQLPKSKVTEVETVLPKRQPISRGFPPKPLHRHHKMILLSHIMVFEYHTPPDTCPIDLLQPSSRPVLNRRYTRTYLVALVTYHLPRLSSKHVI
jgi:hypothetical protein